jgi:hypothetical protein
MGESETKHLYAEMPELRQAIEDYRVMCKKKNSEWLTTSFIPTMLYRAARPEEFRKLVKDNRIATAKIIGFDVDMNIMWQPQVDQIDMGVMPDLALMAK